MNSMDEYQKVIELVYSTKGIICDREKRLNIYKKGNSDYITAVDTSVSEFLKEGLSKLCPDIDFMSEEEEYSKISVTRWILDPIDGTTNLIFDYRLSSVSLGLLSSGVIVFGIVYNPFTDEMFCAEKGKGAYLNGQRLFVSDREISDSLIEFGFGARRKEEADETFCVAKEIFSDCLDVRHICSSALAICYIAAKRCDGFLEKVLQPWDYAAASLILEEAGGVIFDWENKPVQFENATSIVASNQKNQEYLLSKIKTI